MIHSEIPQFTREETIDPVTGRRWIQLTSGNGYCYPLYFFGPTMTSDGGTLLFYRYENDEVQNWKLDIATGSAVRLTAARTPNCLWRFWSAPRTASGVRDLMSVFCPTTDELFYFDGNLLRAVNVQTLADRLVYELPPDRVPCGLPGVSPDGKNFAFTHADLGWWEKVTRKGNPPQVGQGRSEDQANRVHLDVIEVATGTARPLVIMNCWMTHANFYDNQRVLFCHHPTECAILMTDLRGGWYTHLRTQTVEGWTPNHYLSTKRGIMYEGCSPVPHGVIGCCDPDTYAFQDFLTELPIHHIGHDPEGKFWFGDCYRVDAPKEKFLAWLPELRPDAVNKFIPLTRGMEVYGHNQHSHLHPVLLPDRRHILFTGPDDRSRTSHLYLLDVSDLSEAETKVEGTPGFMRAHPLIPNKEAVR